MESVEGVMAAARAQTGLEDFGDESFHSGLERLVRALHDEATLNEMGQVVLPYLVTNLLAQRLQVEDWYRRHPEIDDEPIVAPLIGLGLPRTGSTALSFLLAEDPHARSLRRWEAVEPCPPPSTVEGPDPRIARAEESAALQDRMAPRLAALVPSTPTGPEECQDLMALSFRSHYFQAFAHIPSYSAWLRDADLTETYAYEKRVLKLLQWGQPTRPWRLKCPSHLLWLDALDRVFPDARYVMTHRDPTDVMVSVADLYCEVAGQFSVDVDPHGMGRLNVDHWTVAMQRLLDFRSDGGNDSRFYDIHFLAVQRDPIGEVRRLYEWLGEPVGDEFASGMERWWAAFAADRAENVHPPAARFGLDLDEVRRCFAGYSARMATWVQDQKDRKDQEEQSR
jgi:hypothetical protein